MDLTTHLGLRSAFLVTNKLNTAQDHVIFGKTYKVWAGQHRSVSGWYQNRHYDKENLESSQPPDLLGI